MSQTLQLEFEHLPSLAVTYARALFARKRRGVDGIEVPRIEASVRSTQIEREGLARYNRACGFDRSDLVAPTYLQVLASPLQARLLIAPQFPFRPLGIIHRSSVIKQHRPMHPGEPLSIRAFVEGQRTARRGVEVALKSQVQVGGELTWESTQLILVPRGGSTRRPRKTTRRVTTGAIPEIAAKTIVDVDSNTGRVYARASGDYNPIHLSVITARLFGFQRPIAHGMWSLARCLAFVDKDVVQPLELEAQFLQPLFLPCRALVWQAAEDGGIRFGIADEAGTSGYLAAKLVPLPRS